MKKIFVLLILLSTIVFSAENWEENIKSHKKFQSMEEFKRVGDKIYVNGLIISKVRIARIFTDIKAKRSEVLILKKDLENAFLKKNKDIKSIKITINGKKGKMTAKGKANLLGVPMSVHIEGNFFLNNEGGIEYRITKAVVNRIIPVPKKILKSFSERLNPIFELKEFGVPLYVDSFIFEKDRIFIR